MVMIPAIAVIGAQIIIVELDVVVVVVVVVDPIVLDVNLVELFVIA